MPAESSTSLQALDAIAELASVWRTYEGDPDGALRAITETAARALNVARASVWLLDKDGAKITCADLFETATGSHASGTVLRAADFPRYFAAMLEEETIAADDAHTDPSTAEFSVPYLTPLGIGALLDAPIRSSMRLVGVLCHEHVGPRRRWTGAEQKDAAFLASLASLALEIKHGALREALLAATLESTAEGIVALSADDDERVLAFNQRFVEMWKLDAAQLRSFESVRKHIASKTSLSGLIGAANEAFAGSHDAVDTLELDDGRIFERSSRAQVMAGRVIGRVWSFRDVTAQRRAESALRASEAKMRDLANRDGLTGLFNRRYLLEECAAAVARATAAGEHLALAMIDLDFFKKINDQHGHLVGDAVLRDFAKQIGSRVRGSDLCGRYGGEEFVVLLRGASAQVAAAVIDKVREALRGREPTAELPRYSFSCGLAQLGADGGDVPALLDAADKRLYEAKRAGRDRTVSG